MEIDSRDAGGRALELLTEHVAVRQQLAPQQPYGLNAWHLPSK